LCRDRLAVNGTGQPIRNKLAAPSASLRSVFTGIALRTALTLRISNSVASMPASVSRDAITGTTVPLQGRSLRSARLRRYRTKAFGSLATCASFGICSCSSSTPNSERNVHANEGLQAAILPVARGASISGRGCLMTIRSRRLIFSSRHSSRKRQNHRNTVLLGGKSDGRSRQPMPPRMT